MSYTGTQVPIELGAMGLQTDLPPAQVPPGALIKAFDVSFETGLLTKAPGSAKYNTNALPAGVMAVHDYWPSTSFQRLIAACSDGSIYRDTGNKLFGGNTAIKEGLLNLTPRCMFVEGGQEVALAADLPVFSDFIGYSIKPYNWIN